MRCGAALVVSNRTDEMFQHLLEPATAVNMIVFKAFGILKGCVTLRGDFEVSVAWWVVEAQGAAN